MSGDGLEISFLSREAALFSERLDRVKRSISGVAWYPYHSLSNFSHFDGILTGRRRFLRNLFGRGCLLDIGCGDGDISFLLELFGYRPEAIDFGPTNYNGMTGIRALKKALGSSIQIREADLDAGFDLPPDRRYSAAFALGLLYHLKSPFHFLEALSRHAAYCFLSTRIARWAPGKTAALEPLPVAYLVDPDEVNGDKTNYWMFSPAGLKRICERTGWQICDIGFVGNTRDSDPVSSSGDERAFCLLRNRSMRSFDPGIEFLKGWYEPVEGTWRWTDPDFSFAFDNYGHTDVRLEVGFWLPAEAIQQLGAIRVSARVEDVSLGSQVFTIPGINVYSAAVKGSKDRVVVECSVDKPFIPGGTDTRQLGLAVNRVDVL